MHDKKIKTLFDQHEKANRILLCCCWVVTTQDIDLKKLIKLYSKN